MIDNVVTLQILQINVLTFDPNAHYELTQHDRCDDVQMVGKYIYNATSKSGESFHFVAYSAFIFPIKFNYMGKLRNLIHEKGANMTTNAC